MFKIRQRTNQICTDTIKADIRDFKKQLEKMKDQEEWKKIFLSLQNKMSLANDFDLRFVYL